MARTKQTARMTGRIPGGPAYPPMPTALPTGIKGLMRKLFDPRHTTTPFVGKFDGRIGPSDDDDDDVKMSPRDAESSSGGAARAGGDNQNSFLPAWKLLCDPISSYLAPHEILSVLQTSKAAWNALNGQHRRRILLTSIFIYYAISQEAALEVQTHVQGGWRTFAPVLVALGRYLVQRVYGKYLEPDRAHRTIIAEQVCFWKPRRRRGQYPIHFRKAGNLLGYAYHKEHASVFLPEPAVVQPHAVPTLETLRHHVTSRQVCWGNVNPCLVAYYDGNRMATFVEQNQQWMRQNAETWLVRDEDDVLKELWTAYRTRLQQGLHPPIWLMYDTSSEPMEYALCFGPNKQQFVAAYSTYSHLKDDWEDNLERFVFCLVPGLNGAEGYNDGACTSVAEFLVSYAYSREPMEEPTPELCVAVWCKRHGIAPFDRSDIDWRAVIREECPTGRDDEAQAFFLDALTSPLFGPANVNQFLL